MKGSEVVFLLGIMLGFLAAVLGALFEPVTIESLYYTLFVFNLFIVYIMIIYMMEVK